MTENNTECAGNSINTVSNLISNGSMVSLCVIVLLLLIIKFFVFRMKRQNIALNG